jgi:hypothetical protein
MSPEQIRAQAVDHRSDIFSFGAYGSLVRKSPSGHDFHRKRRCKAGWWLSQLQVRRHYGCGRSTRHRQKRFLHRWRLPSVLVTRFKIRESGYGKA